MGNRRPIEWCVCSDRSSSSFQIMSREEREAILKVWMKLKDGVPNRVLKTFPTKKKAREYVRNMKLTNKTINSL